MPHAQRLLSQACSHERFELVTGNGYVVGGSEGLRLLRFASVCLCARLTQGDARIIYTHLSHDDAANPAPYRVPAVLARPRMQTPPHRKGRATLGYVPPPPTDGNNYYNRLSKQHNI